MKHVIGQRSILSCNVSCVLATLPKPLFPDQGQELFFQRRQVALDHVPDGIPVDPEIMVNTGSILIPMISDHGMSGLAVPNSGEIPRTASPMIRRW